jgi:predicted DnaQ family exonuclease/DinG family helicase
MAKQDFILQRFVALDLETTGFDFVRDDVIEVGAVKVEDGEIAGTFEHYVSTDRAIPYRVKQLTGITEKDLAGSPPIKDVLKGLDEFVSDLPVVAHHAPFDVGFLKAKGYEPRAEVHDTLAIARVVLPRAKDHRLSTLLAGFGIDAGVSHRACADAMGVARLILALSDEMKVLGPRLMGLLNQIMVGCRWEEGVLFRRGEKLAVKSAMLDLKSGFSADFVNAYRNTFGEGRVKPEKTKTPLDREEVAGMFAEAGGLADSLRDFETRPEQVSMAGACARMYNEDGFLVVEAGTGTGKSMAYLFPSVLWSLANGERVLVSTNTKNLQDQLFYKDIPAVSTVLSSSFRAALLKGRSNYICLAKWHSLISDVSSNLSCEDRKAVLPLVVWLEQTRTGEFAECTGFRYRERPGVLNAICCEWNYCLGNKCSYRSRCFLNRVRDAAAGSHLVVVNHALLLSDLVANSRAVGDYSRLVIDEAHNLEDAATEHMGRKVSLARIASILDVVSPERGYGGGLLGKIERRLGKTSQALGKSVAGLKRTVHDTRDLAKVFFNDLLRMARTEGDWGKRRYAEGDERIGAVVPDGMELAAKLSELKDGLAGLGAWISSSTEVDAWSDIIESLSARQVDIVETSAELKSLLSAHDPADCYWTEIEGKNEKEWVELRSAPIDVGRSLCHLLYEKLDSCIFTSATLTVASSLDFFLERVGLTRFCQERVRTVSLGSPFDFSEQTLVLLARYLPTPQTAGFTRSLARLLERVILGTRKGTLVLLTSYAMLNDLVSRLSKRFEEEEITALVQGESGSRTRILEEFRTDTSSVVFGTDSFWEGVDVPGESLEMVVIGKLPFPVPNEPIVQARTEHLENQSLDPFSSYMLPRAVIRFRQGFGRLVRKKTDKGVVIVADSRAGAASYGEVFLGSLPAEVLFCNSEQEVVERTQKFWEDRV